MSKINILVTGATDGIGKQTALDLARQGAHVLIHGRNPAKCQAVIAEIQQQAQGASLDYVVADLSVMAQVSELATAVQAKVERLDVLLHNAGVFMTERVVTPDGFEMTFAVNHLAPFLLTHLLLDLVKRSTPARIITVASQVHRNGRIEFDNLQGEKRFGGNWAYSNSKFGNVLFAFELARQLQGTHVTSNALHPGVISTKLLKTGWGMGGDSLERGAQTSVYLATSPDVANVTGKYFDNRHEVAPAAMALDTQLQQQFWQTSKTLLGLA